VTVGTWCSGTVIDAKQGLVVTASHCVRKLKHVETNTRAGDTYAAYDAVDVTLTKLNDDGTVSDTSVFEAEVIGDAHDNDVAILKVSKPNAFSTDAKLSASSPKFGDHVFTIGHPVMFPTVVAEGYISNPRVDIHPENDDRLLTVLLFTAHMDSGSSGGALYNDAGELIGVTNWQNEGGEYFASPASNITALLKDIGLKLED